MARCRPLKGESNAENVHNHRSTSDVLTVRRAFTTLIAALVGAAVLAIVPVGLLPAEGEGEPTLAVSITEGLTGSTIDVTGTGCFLPDGITGADGLLFQLIDPAGRAAASATLPVERDGSWAAPFVVPNGTPAGTYSIKGTCIAPMYEDLGILTAGTFTVTGEGPRGPDRRVGSRRVGQRHRALPRLRRPEHLQPDRQARHDRLPRHGHGGLPRHGQLRHQPGLQHRRDQRAQGRPGLGLGQRRHDRHRPRPGGRTS